MQQKLVSIVTPCYNGEEFIDNFMKMILSQKYKKIQLIVVNDGSTDNSEKKILSYKENFEKKGYELNYIKQENGGPGSAINKGLKYIKGDFYSWIDIDDYYGKNSIESMVKFLENNPNYNIVRGKMKAIDYMSGRVILEGKPRNTNNENLFYDYLYVIGDSYCFSGIWLVRTNILDKYIPNRNIYPSRFGQGWQLLLPILYTNKVGFVDEFVFYYNVRDSSISHNPNKSVLSLIKKNKGYHDILKHVLKEMNINDNERRKYYKSLNYKYFRENIKALIKVPYNRLKMKKMVKKMKEIVDNNKCSGCSLCSKICPFNAIKMIEDNEGFLYPVKDKNKCKECGLCSKKCPVNNIENKYANPEAFAVFNKNDDIRLSSSSGGIFYLLAEYVLKSNGIVFGASFSDNFENVKHIYVDDIKDIYKIMTSKYLQSEINDSYIICEKFLKEGRMVLFTGTPCQIEGLLNFLKKKYSNLYTQDIICHGCPSPKIWKEYLKIINSKFHNAPTSVNFRDKTKGWEDFSLKITYDNGTYLKSHNNDDYMKIFLSNYSLRKSCYNCKFKKYKRYADLTLADFWNIDKIDKDIYDKKGTSLVIVNTKNGNEIFDNIKNNINFKKEDIYDAIKYNSPFVESVKEPKKRDEFFTEIFNGNFRKIVKKYTNKPLYKRIGSKIKKVLKRLVKNNN